MDVVGVGLGWVVLVGLRLMRSTAAEGSTQILRGLAAHLSTSTY